jgi:hypothetical protein
VWLVFGWTGHSGLVRQIHGAREASFGVILRLYQKVQYRRTSRWVRFLWENALPAMFHASLNRFK